MREEDCYKTLHYTHAGFYHFLRMPFGLFNGPAIFQRTLDIAVSKYKWKTTVVYLHGLLIYFHTVEQHIAHIQEFLTAFGDAKVTLKLKKSLLFIEVVEYLRHIIKPGRLKVNRVHTSGLREARSPGPETDVRSLLGLCSVYRRFLKLFCASCTTLE